MVAASPSTQSISDWLGSEADSLLTYQAKVDKSTLHLPGPDWVDRIFAQSDRSPQVLRSLQQLYSTGRLANTGYLSILPVDQGIEHSAGASFAPNPIYFDPANIVELAIAGGLQRRREHPGCTGHGVSPVRPQNSLHRQAQP